MDSLVLAKEALEADLTRSVMEKKGFETDLKLVSEHSVELDLEKNVFFAFMETQMGQMGFGFDRLLREKVEIERMKKEREVEIEFLKQKVNELNGFVENESFNLKRVSEERDLLKKDCDKRKMDFDRAVEEANGLSEKVVVMEKGEIFMKEEVGKLKLKCEALVNENAEKERAFEVVIRGRDLAESKVVELEKMAENLKRETERILKEKNEIEKEKKAMEVKVGKLDKDMGDLNKILLELGKGTEALQTKNLELEEFISQNMKDRELEIKSLLEEKSKNETSITVLEKERDEIKKVFERISWEYEDKQRKCEELFQQKNEIEEAKFSQERQIFGLHNEVSGLRDMVLTLRTSCSKLEEKNKELLSEVGQYKEAFDSVSHERDETSKAFDEENKKVKELMLVISSREKRIEEIVEDLQNLKSECVHLLEKSKVTENSLEALVKANETAQKNIFEAHREIDEWKAKFESASTNSEKVLTMLKHTVALVSSNFEHDKDSKREVEIEEQILNEEIEPHAAKLVAIKIAFENKEKMLEETNQQVEYLRLSAADAQKKRSFWTLVSSAVTLVAAASVAYVAKVR